ncbi:MAG TPA: zinc ABC transporter substrate-binding protein [Cellvibrio sp.]|nr:zinc ABC transporter substrate-binding protein [Cellvibrio sp.]
MTRILGLLGCVMLMVAANAQAKLRVLSSIKPLTLIAQEIGGDSAIADTLLPASASPHDYPLKVSDYSRLQAADIVLWVGPELESFLQKPVANLPREKVVTAYALAGLSWPLESHGHSEKHVHERDPHLWLNPQNAIVLARALGEQLMRLDPGNKALYVQNIKRFVDKTTQLDEMLRLKLKPLQARGFAVYHEGYGHFVSHYGLRQLDYVTFTPEQRPGAKHLKELREILAKEGVCLFLEPYYEQPSVLNLAHELNLRTAVLDALGSQNNIADYSQLLGRMAEAFVSCLGDKGV